MLSVVTWKWQQPNYRKVYTAERVNTLYRMVRRHYAKPFDAVCVTDDPEGLDADIRVVPLWPEYLDVPSPHGPPFPACYVRLKAFAPEMADVLGPRFVSLDLDTVVTGDLEPLWDRDEDFVIWSLALPLRGKTRTHFQGSMWLLRAGTRPQVWERFTLEEALTAFRCGHHGNDQGWMQYVLGDDGAATWNGTDGVYSYKHQVLTTYRGQLPRNARVVMFHGKPDAWEPEAYDRHAWIREHYQ